MKATRKRVSVYRIQDTYFNIGISLDSNDFVFLPRKIREMERNAFQARNRERATKNGILGPK